MREKKYANVLLEDEDKEKLSRFKDINEDELDDDIKLSSTRELKFRELQEKIDDIKEEDLNKELHDDFDLIDTAERKILNRKFEKIADDINDELPSIEERDKDADALEIPKEKGTMRLVAAYSKKNEDEDDDEDADRKVNDDDIYLTTAFKPLKKRFKLSKLFKKLIFLFFVLGILCALFYFVLKPIYGLYVNSQPHMIYNNSLDYMEAAINEKIDDIYSDGETIFMDGEIGIRTSGEVELRDINNYTFDFYTGIDPIGKAVEYGYYANNQEKVGYRVILNDDNRYVNYIGSNNYLEMDKESANSESISKYYGDYVEKVRTLTKDEMKYLVSKTTDILKNSIGNEEIIAQKDIIKVKDEEISVIRNSLKIDGEVALRMQKSIVNGIIEDSKLSDIYSSLLNVSNGNIKTKLDEALEIKDDSIINIYTKNGVQVVGIDIQSNGFRDFYWYQNEEGTFETYIKMPKASCEDNKDCDNAERNVYSAVGSKENDNILVNIKYNEKEFGDLIVKNFSDEQIDFDFKIKIDNDDTTGEFLVNLKENNAKGKIATKIKDNNYEFDVNVKIKKGLSIGEIDGTKIPLNSDSWEEETINYKNLIKNKDDFQYLVFWLEEIDGISEYLPFDFISDIDSIKNVLS